MKLLRAGLPKSLFGRLALVQVLLGALVAAGFVAVLEYSHGDFHRELARRQSILLAERILEDYGKAWRRSPRDADGISATLRRIGRMNPAVELYWLSGSGAIVASSVPPARLLVNRLDVEALRAVAAQSEVDPSMRAIDPSDPARPKPFALATAPAAGGERYLIYVVLADDDAHVFTRLVWASTFKQALTMIAGVIILALVSTLVILGVVLRRFRQLSQAMNRFGRDAPTDWAPVDAVPTGTGTSELDRMSEDFNAMAGRIGALVRELKDDDRKMREMFADISHDLRTPLTVIQGELEVLLQRNDTLDTAEREAAMRALLEQVHRLGRLVEGVFELAKLRNPHYRIRPEPVSLGEFIHDVAAKFAGIASASGLALEVDAAEAHLFASADVTLLERVMDNLVGNSIQHAAGASRVRIGLRDTGDGLEVRVSDDGRGFLARPLQTDAKRYVSPRADGSGLGLQIVDSMLSLHGSELVVDGAPGRGTTCSFVLPRSSARTSVIDGDSGVGTGECARATSAPLRLGVTRR